MKILSLIIIALLSFSACSQQPVQKDVLEKNQQMPKWIFMPNQDGILGAVGSSRVHFKGIAAQRNLAIERALNEMSKESGVEVHTTSTLNQSSQGTIAIKNEHGEYSFQTSQGGVHAYIAAVWINPTNKEMYIWMREKK